jgi:four helix bundle protein
LSLGVLPKLSHEKLDVYQKAIQFLALSARLSSALPRGNAEIVDQLKRGALSVPLNIAEARGRTGSLENARHFAIARGSALECGAILDACDALGLIDAKSYVDGKRLIVAVVSMLSRLCMKK